MKYKDIRKNKLNIFQFAIIIALVIFIILMLTSGNTKDVDMGTIKSALSSDPAVTEMSEKTSADISNELGVDLTDVEIIGYEADDVMDVSRMYVFKTSDDSKMQEIIDAVDESIASDSNDFNGYGTNQYDLLQAAIKLEKGNYYFAAVSDQAEQWEDEFISLLN